ncbi:MAG TPA: TraB/GumN family protein [Desulfuromonadales bacterium]|nr:TraB/GumN family protein [Desulfuromonadales bacterium]
MKKFAIALITVLLFALSAYAAAPIWEVKKGDSVIYLGGTCHLLRDSDFPLPAAFDVAYRQSAAVVFETDIGELQSPEFQQKMMAALFYRDGRSLPDDLSPEAYLALQRYCEKAGFPVAMLHPMKPAMAVLTLVTLELQKLGITEAGADRFYYDKALAEGKKIEGLETADEQLDFLAVMGKGMEDSLIEQSLADLSRTGTMFNEIIQVWRSGNEKELGRLLVESTRKDFPEIYQTLLVARNADWLPKIEKLLATPERELVLVGAAHLVGGDGLLESLKKQEYEVKQLD